MQPTPAKNSRILIDGDAPPELTAAVAVATECYAPFVDYGFDLITPSHRPGLIRFYVSKDGIEYLGVTVPLAAAIDAAQEQRLSVFATNFARQASLDWEAGIRDPFPVPS